LFRGPRAAPPGLPRGGSSAIIDGMPDHAATIDAPPPSGPFYTNWGPLNGPILGESPALGVLAERVGALPIGIAYPVGLVEHRRGRAKTFRLVVNKVELEGRWLCVGRVFVRLGEAAEEL
jgi:hypothetical protein